LAAALSKAAPDVSDPIRKKAGAVRSEALTWLPLGGLSCCPSIRCPAGLPIALERLYAALTTYDGS